MENYQNNYKKEFLRICREFNLPQPVGDRLSKYINNLDDILYGDYCLDIYNKFTDLRISEENLPFSSFSTYLRLLKLEIFKLIAEYINKKSWDYKISRIISLTADLIVKLALRYLYIEQELIVVAMGKWGGKDLNFFSDIDLIILREDSISEEKSLNLFYKFNQLISEQTVYGFCFYTDYNLRPGGETGPIIPSLSELIIFYTKQISVWERLAWLRARGINIKKEHKLFLLMKKIVYHRYVDFNNLESIVNIWKKILSSRTTLNRESVDLKLGTGGIRELEFIIFTKFLIKAGRLPVEKFFGLSIEDILNFLREYKIIDKVFYDFFRDKYYYLRFLEDFVQSYQNKRTHILNSSLKYTKTPELISNAKQIMEVTSKEFKKMFEIESIKEKLTDKDIDYLKEKHEELLESLQFKLTSKQEQKSIENLIFVSLKVLQNRGSSDKFFVLKDFFKAIRGRRAVFALLAQNMDFAQYIIELLVEGDYFKSIIYKHTEVLDLLFLGKKIFSAGLKIDDLNLQDPRDLESLSQRVLSYKIYNEFKLAFKYRKAQLGIKKLFAQLTNLSLEIISKLAEVFIPNLTVFAMGKLGAGEFVFNSDLDIIFLSDNPNEEDIKKLRRFISFVSSPYQKALKIYDIDLDFRPNKQGPVLTSTNSFVNYYSTSDVWKLVALFKLDFVYGNKKIKTKILDFRDKILNTVSLSDFSFKPLDKVYTEKDDNKKFNIKYGRCGFLDIEYLTRYLSIKYAVYKRGILSTLEVLEAFTDYAKEIKTVYLNYLDLDLAFRLEFGGQYPSLLDNKYKDSKLLDILKILKEDLDTYKEI